MEAKHTPGPWEVAGTAQKDFNVYGGPEKDRAGGVVYLVAKDLSEANARLIAAAPTMFKNLQDTVDFIWRELRENPDKEDMDGSIMNRLIDLQTDLLETLRKARGGA